MQILQVISLLLDYPTELLHYSQAELEQIVQAAALSDAAKTALLAGERRDLAAAEGSELIAGEQIEVGGVHAGKLGRGQPAQLVTGQCLQLVAVERADLHRMAEIAHLPMRGDAVPHVVGRAGGRRRHGRRTGSPAMATTV